MTHQGSHLTSWHLRSHLCCGENTTCPRETKKSLRRVSDTTAIWPGGTHTLKTALHSPLLITHRWILHHLQLWRIIQIMRRNPTSAPSFIYTRLALGCCWSKGEGEGHDTAWLERMDGSRCERQEEDKEKIGVVWELVEGFLSQK